MKKIVLIPMFLLMLPVASYSQNNQVCQPDTILIYTDNSIVEFDSMFLFNSYNAEGLFTRCKEHYGNEFMKKEQVRDIPPIQSKTEYEYDLNHNLLKMTVYSYSVPRPDMTISNYTYEGGKLSLYTRHGIDFFDDTHILDSVTYQYDALGRILDEVAYKNFAESLVYAKHTVYEYDANKVVVTSEGLKFDNWGDWVQLNKETRTFDEGGLLSGIETESYGNPVKSDTYSYDGAGRVIGILTRILNGGDWVNTRLLEYAYDMNGHLYLATIKTWQNETFVDANRAVYELNDAGYPTEVTFEKWNGAEWVDGTWKAGFTVFSEDYLERQNKFVCLNCAKRIVIHYADTPMPGYEVNERQTEAEFCEIYPNPTGGFITITGRYLKQAEVVNTLGQRIFSITSEGDMLHIDMQGQPAGVYFVNVTDAEGRKCVKRVVKE